MPLLEPKPYQTHSLRTFWAMLVPGHNLAFGLYLLSAASVLYLTVTIWRSATVLHSVRYSAFLFATVLVAPHLTVYDLVILAPAMLLLADWLIGQPQIASNRRLGTLLYGAYVLPLVGPFTIWTHVQLYVIAMTAIVYLIWRDSEQKSARLPE